VNTRHAAALGLLAWYLIAPPLRRPPAYLSIPLAPYSQWFRHGMYFSREECERDEQRFRRRAEGDEVFHVCFTARFDEAACEADESVLNATCIETDDPRLNGM
jgi:hypothetical protein